MIARSHALTPSNVDIEAFVRRYCGAHDGKIENTRQKGVVRIRTPRLLVDGKTVADAHGKATFDKDRRSDISRRTCSVSPSAIPC